MRLVFILWGCEILYMAKLLSWTLMECGLWLARAVNRLLCAVGSDWHWTVSCSMVIALFWFYEHLAGEPMGSRNYKTFINKDTYLTHACWVPGCDAWGWAKEVWSLLLCSQARECWKDPLGQFAGCFRSPGAMGFGKSWFKTQEPTTFIPAFIPV